ncbi:MAG: beta-ketoacyl synthase chain length factor [Gallionellaceae bacterium]|nr:beta-ketoacyl synthase chain length factor [Gallionellaceae bacterium]
MRIFVEGVGLLGPGLNDWQTGSLVVAGQADYVPMPTILATSTLLPPAERRRTGVPVKLALAVGEQAFLHAQRDMAATATVFTSSGGDGDNVHQINETLATAELEVSPTRFHNSVHNAAAGYWSIAAQSHQPSTSLCGYNASFAVGLLEAATQITVDSHAVALIAYDHAYPQPLHAVRPVSASFGVALVLTAQATAHTFATLDVNFVAGTRNPTTLPYPALETLRANVPAARSLPLLSALARSATATVVLELTAGNHLHIATTPCK